MKKEFSMAEGHGHHEELVSGIAKQLKSVLQKSEQAVYFYLDDSHKICNKKFADLLGYKSAKEWADTDAPLADVIKKDQKNVIKAYEQATEKFVASSVEVSMKNVMTGKVVKATMIVVPMVYDGHIFSMHFFNAS
jgi:hypothetical protein